MNLRHLCLLLLLLPSALVFGLKTTVAFEDRFLNSVVSVLPTWPQNAGQQRLEEPEGSGFAYASGGIVATAWHVVGQATAIRVRLADGRQFPAEVIAGDPLSDIALLRVPVDLPVPERAAPPPLGAKVCAVGNAFGLDLSVTCGVLSASGRTGIGFNVVEDFLQTDAAVNPGASGGALFDEQGRLIGLLSAIFTKESDANIGVNFAVSVALLERVAEELLGNGKVRYRSLGLKAEAEITGDGMPALRIVGLLPDGPAAKAGLQAGDRLLAAAGQPLRSEAALLRAVQLLSGGEVLSLVFLRDGERRDLQVSFP
ncbi:S1C family serine protease [Limibacillus halophilus]|uniref:S1-C subfamily serine protease n=1 Tax=Limibacillus halophilus TaxID=1579333 RepID=A0A839SYX9_9PROT|nr:trypsin-like peptidase domain-containing protein [Limibacillus halophilus]MBB3066880.1 S1-C subfamily serine protease [Limibacillus halophilus]